MGLLATFNEKVLLWIHGRRLGIIGDGQSGVNTLLVADGFVMAASRSGPAPITLLGTGLSGAGAVTLTGAVVGDGVFKVYDQNAANWVDVTSSFESTISVANQIQETASVSGHQIIVFLQPGS